MRDFIRKRVSAIVEVGRAGTDVQYALKTTQAKLETEIASIATVGFADHALDQLMRDPRAWKTSRRPDSPFRLYLTD